MNPSIVNPALSGFPNVCSSFTADSAARLMNMNGRISFKKVCQLLAIGFIIGTSPLSAEETSQYRMLSLADLDLFDGNKYEFNNVQFGDFQKNHKLQSLKVRGWQISKNVYLGQAKVAKQWGLGFVYEDGDTVYGLNHRGLQVMKRF